MGVFHVFKIVEMVANRGKFLKWTTKPGNGVKDNSLGNSILFFAEWIITNKIL